MASLNIEPLNIELILLFSFFLNTIFLIFWFSILALAQDWVFKIHSKWFKLNKETFLAIHYFLMGMYKIGIIAFFLVPYIAIRLNS